MDQVAQRLGLRLGTRTTTGRKLNVSSLRRAVPAINRVARAPVGRREIAIQVDPVGIGAQPELAAIRVDGQHHMVTQLIGGDAAPCVPAMISPVSGLLMAAGK